MRLLLLIPFLLVGCTPQRIATLPAGTKLILPTVEQADAVRAKFPVDPEHFSRVVELPAGYGLTDSKQ